MKLELAGLPILALACATPQDQVLALQSGAFTKEGPGMAVEAAANWKERLSQPYVFLDHSGDYRGIGRTMQQLFADAEELGLLPDGPPFALFFDDPGSVPIASLRARACLPVESAPEELGELRYEVLPRAMVAYARVHGAHDEVARGYAPIFAYLRDLGWQQGGPVRELYLRAPSQTDEPITEIQIPWMALAQP